jgi:hypothetical protein
MLLAPIADHPLASGGNLVILIIISFLFTALVIYTWRKSKGFAPEMEEEDEHISTP